MPRKPHLAREYQMDCVPYARLTCGTSNRISPLCVYVRGRFYGRSMCECDYNTLSKVIHRKFKTSVSREVISEEWFSDQFISDIDCKMLKMAPNKNKCFTFEIYLRQKGEIRELKDVKPKLEDMFSRVMSEVCGHLEKNQFIITAVKKAVD